LFRHQRVSFHCVYYIPVVAERFRPRSLRSLVETVLTFTCTSCSRPMSVPRRSLSKYVFTPNNMQRSLEKSCIETRFAELNIEHSISLLRESHFFLEPPPDREIPRHTIFSYRLIHHAAVFISAPQSGLSSTSFPLLLPLIFTRSPPAGYSNQQAPFVTMRLYSAPRCNLHLSARHPSHPCCHNPRRSHLSTSSLARGPHEPILIYSNIQECSSRCIPLAYG